MRNAYKILAGEPEGKTPFGRPSRRWKDSNKMELGETEWECGDWINLEQDRAGDGIL
jgi:hypothetical protein